MIKYLALIPLLLAGFPALADSCIPKEEAFAKLAARGYEPTFVDKSGEYIFILAEDGNGNWVMIALVGPNACPVVGGPAGVHIPRKPNA